MLWTSSLTCFKLISSLKYSLYFAEVTTLVAVHVVHAVSIHYVAFLHVFPFMRLALIVILSRLCQTVVCAALTDNCLHSLKLEFWYIIWY
jgi:hypothetical protein